MNNKQKITYLIGKFGRMELCKLMNIHPTTLDRRVNKPEGLKVTELEIINRLIEEDGLNISILPCENSGE